MEILPEFLIDGISKRAQDSRAMKDRVYFRACFAKAGFLDQLWQLKRVRKLGLSLGYAYFYSEIHSFRNFWPPQPLSFPWFLVRLIFRVHHRFVQIFPGNSVWSHLGFNQHFARLAEAQKQPGLPKCRQRTIILNDHVLKQAGVSTLEELQAYIRKIVAEAYFPGTPLVLNIHLGYPVNSFSSMVDSIGDSVDDLDLQAVYSHHRRKRPGDSNYPKQGVKTLVAIRQGDIAAVRTPWDTWIYWPRGEQVELMCFRECRRESEFNQLTVADFHRFISGIGSRFADNTFAVQIFSDGYERFFSNFYAINNKPEGLGISQEEMDSLLKYRRRYAREFEVFKKIKNSRLCVGEWPLSKFFRFVDAALTADLLVAAFPRQMAAFHLRRHFSSNAPPPPPSSFCTSRSRRNRCTISLREIRPGKLSR